MSLQFYETYEWKTLKRCQKYLTQTCQEEQSKYCMLEALIVFLVLGNQTRSNMGVLLRNYYVSITISYMVFA